MSKKADKEVHDTYEKYNEIFDQKFTQYIESEDFNFRILSLPSP
jgi:hypothetical protein